MKSKTTTIFTLFLFCFSVFTSYAQSGSEAVYQKVRKLGVLANVLYVAAHPDDENTRMISYLSNHLQVNTTYLSLTRGDGGQNLIGPEIREMLGLIRTHELLGARSIDHGHQRFTRANDFGYSKTPAETFNIWDRNAVLSDVVWTIRETRPDVIINRFSTDTSRPNHGHHTASAILALEAFDLSGDPTKFSEQLTFTQAWQPRRIYWNTSWWFYGSQEAFAKTDKSKMLAIDIGSYDPITGESNSEIAGRSRSMHKSQGFGSAETRGESLDYIDLLKDASGTVPTSLFDGIDITWNRVPGGQPLVSMVTDLEKNFDFKSPEKSVPALLNIYAAIDALPDSYWKAIKKEECAALIKDCLGLFVEARTTVYKTGPKRDINVVVETINRSKSEVSLLSVRPDNSDTTFNFNLPLNYNQGVVKEMKWPTPDHLSIPYWLEHHPTEGMYIVPEQQLRGQPSDKPAMLVNVDLLIMQKPFTFKVPVIYKTVDPAEGEITRPVSIVPPVTVEANAEVLMFRQGEPREIILNLTAARDSVGGSLQLTTSTSGWKVFPSTMPWSFDKAGESQEVKCTITPPDGAGKADLIPLVLVDGDTFSHKTTIIDYAHLPYMTVVSDATVHLQSMNIETTQRTIGYVAGAGDDIPASLHQIGYNIDILDPDKMNASDLSGYQVMILGVRAFNTIEALSYKNKLLFDWVKAGGTLIVQYNVNRGLVTNDIAPYPLTLSRDRITEENAPVSIIAPDHPALNHPNKITSADFNDWTQERGLYFPNQWDEHFVPLLEMHDTGENPTKGALLVAPYGDGYYVYTGLSFFRHLPAGSVGPYRLLSNLISLGHKKGRS